MKIKLSFLLIGIFVFLSFSCAQKIRSDEMSIEELRSAIKNDSSLVILDVRTPQELEGPLGRIDGVINIPVQELETRISELSPYKNNNIAVICRSGNRSTYATKILEQKGFKAKNVLGGMIQFRAEK